MTRINVVDVKYLTDQHLMAEYAELAMVLSAAKRSKTENYISSTKYTLNKGHVKFFYNKKKWLYNRYQELIDELYLRGYNINPENRNLNFDILDKFSQIEWEPVLDDVKINCERILERIDKKSSWYTYFKISLEHSFNKNFLNVYKNA